MRDDVQEPLGPCQAERAALLLEAGRQLQSLIDEMLDISRIETGRLAMRTQDFELCRLLDAVLDISEPQAATHGVVLHRDYERPCPVLMRNDPDRLRQVMLNLVSNAIKYNRPGGQAKITLERDGERVYIVVQDNGLGMMPAQLAQLFQPFNRLGRERSGIEGTGIGLVLTRQLVGLLGGELAIDSCEGEGTTVRVTLPIGGVRVVDAPGDTGTVSDYPDPGGCVLYVEDNTVNVLLVRQLLSRWPTTQLMVAGSVAEGMAQLRARRPDLVLLDMQLPDGNGVEVLQQMQQDPAMRGIPVVTLSASAEPEEVAAARAAGALDYWTKPIDFERFVDGVWHLLARV
jgi:CheY-like chemotaxis protein